MIILNKQITNEVNLSCGMNKDNEYWIIFTERGDYSSLNIHLINYKERTKKESYVSMEIWYDEGFRSSNSPQLYKTIRNIFKDYSDYSDFDSVFKTYILTDLNNDEFGEFVEMLFNSVEECCEELFK